MKSMTLQITKNGRIKLLSLASLQLKIRKYKSIRENFLLHYDILANLSSPVLHPGLPLQALLALREQDL